MAKDDWVDVSVDNHDHDDWHDVPLDQNKPSMTESALRGAAQGASFGFEDELSGLGGAVGNKLGSLGVDEIQSTHPEVQAKIDAIRSSQPSFGDVYRKTRNEERSRNQFAQESNPHTYLAADIGSAIVNPIAAGARGLQGAAKMGATLGLGNSDADLTEGELGRSIKDTAFGSVGGIAGHGAATLLGKGAQTLANTDAAQAIGSKLGSVSDKVKEAIKKKAGKFAENSIGATRRQAEEFAPGTGRYLLDNNLVKFGDGPGNIAKRVDTLMDKHGKDIETILKELDEQGVKIDRETLAKYVKERASKFGDLDSAKPLVKKLRAEATELTTQHEIDKAIGEHGSDDVENVFNQLEEQGIKLDKDTVAQYLKDRKDGFFTGGSRPISKVESDKRGFQKKVKNWIDPDTSLMNKEMSRAYRNAVEDTAEKASPDKAELFKQRKKDFGILDPVQEYAEKRDLQLNQHPIGGFNDMTTGAVGAAVKGKAGLALIPLRRMIAPRISSSAAVSMESVAKLMEAAPKYAGAIQKAAEKGPQALGITLSILSKDPEFRKKLEDKE